MDIIRSQEHLCSVVKEALIKLGLPNTFFSVEKMPCSTLGQTVFDDKTTIKINSVLIGESVKIAKTIVAHEAAHAKVGYKNGHNFKWYQLANSYSQKIGGGQVTEDVYSKDIQLSLNFWKIHYKYVYKCSKCGRLIGFNQKEYAYLNNSDYIHNGCGGNWIKMK